MDLMLQDKTALVTGSTAGIGRAIAETLVAEGAVVLVNGRDAERTRAAADALAGPGRAVPLHGDVGSRVGVDGLLKRLEGVRGAAGVGPIDILVNNAGVFEPQPFFDIPDEAWQAFYEMNVLSGVRMSRALAPGMRERGWGRILFISSESGISIPEEMVHYGTTKTAQLAVMRGLAKTLRGSGVTVNAVLPGPTWTRGVATFVAQMAEQEGTPVDQMREAFVPRHRPKSIIGRFAEPQEVASLVAYLASPLSSATTGASVRVEGGIVDDLG